MPRAGQRSHGDPIHGEDDALFRQPHDERAVRVIDAEIVQLERRAAERIVRLLRTVSSGRRYERILDHGADDLLHARAR